MDFTVALKIPGMEDMISIFVPEDFDVRIDEIYIRIVP